MTKYNYLQSMQELCFRATQALSVLKETALKDFYKAAEDGFYNQCTKIPVEKASQHITPEQLDNYLRFEKFVNDKEYDAAICLRNESEVRKHA